MYIHARFHVLPHVRIVYCAKFQQSVPCLTIKESNCSVSFRRLMIACRLYLRATRAVLFSTRMPGSRRESVTNGLKWKARRKCGATSLYEYVLKQSLCDAHESEPRKPAVEKRAVTHEVRSRAEVGLLHGADRAVVQIAVDHHKVCALISDDRRVANAVLIDERKFSKRLSCVCIHIYQIHVHVCTGNLYCKIIFRYCD